MMHKNYFSRLGFDKVSFDITEQEINQKYFEMQKLHHPDKVGTTDIRLSTELNEAYSNLVDPLARAQHIFELNRIDIFSGPISLRIFELMSEPLKNYNVSFEQMKYDFYVGDLDSAYQNWCACQYLKRMIKE